MGPRAGDRGPARGACRPSSRARSSRSCSRPCSRSRPRPATACAPPARELAELRRAVIEIAASQGLAIGAAATHPFALCPRPGDRRPAPLPRARRRARPDRAARADLRHPRPRRDRGRRPRDLRRRRDPPLPAAVPRPVGELALLGGRADRPHVLARADLPPVPARGDPAALRHLGDLRAPGRADDARRRDPRLHLPLVGRAPAPAAGHGRDADLRPADAGRAHRRARGAHGQPGAPHVRALTTPTSRWSSIRPSSSTTTRSAPRATAPTASWSTSAPASRSQAPRDGARAGRAARRERRRARLPRRSSNRSRTCSPTAPERTASSRTTATTATCARLVAEIAEHTRP